MQAFFCAAAKTGRLRQSSDVGCHYNHLNMEKFLTTNIWGLLILGALGSILGYILIVLFNFLKRKLLLASGKFSKKRKERNLKLFKKKFISNIVANEILESNDYRIFFHISNLIVNLIVNLSFLLFFGLLIIILLLNHDIVGKAPILIFIVGMVISFPAFNIGYNLGGFKSVYHDFLQKEKEKHNIVELETAATEIFNAKKNE